MNGLLRRNCRSFQAFVMPGKPSGRAVTVPILCFRPVANGNVVGDVSVPHVPQGLVDLLPVPLINQPALLPVVAHHLTAPAHLPRRCLSPPGEAAFLCSAVCHATFTFSACLLCLVGCVHRLIVILELLCRYISRRRDLHTFLLGSSLRDHSKLQLPKSKLSAQEYCFQTVCLRILPTRLLFSVVPVSDNRTSSAEELP